ncbi:MAG: DUF2809 domain-containing protein [Gemmatimonas sp.]
MTKAGVKDSRSRSRAHYAALFALTIAAGLASRRYPQWLPVVLARYAGDTLWAAMVFWMLAVIAPRRPTQLLATVALGVSYAVELSQLYHASWLDAARSSTFGALVLGRGFLWSDLACYTVGVGLAASLDSALCARRSASAGGT